MGPPQKVLVTTAWLRPGDEVDRFLRSSGLEVQHSSFQDRDGTGVSLEDLVDDVDAVIAGTDAFTAELIDQAERLRVIGRTGVGFDNIDVDAATRRGVAVCPTPGINRQSVAEYTIGLLLSVARRIPQSISSVRSGGWEQSSGRELEGATLGVVGFGAIGRTVATLALAFGMRVVAFDPFVASDGFDKVESVPLDTLLAQSDFITLHMSLSEDTRHMIDAAAFRKMKRGSYLINAARGGVVEEEALAEALRSGILAGAALDTTEIEPLPADSPLRQFDNLLITAHVGAATVESRRRSGMLAAQAVVSVLGGTVPPQTVNPDFQHQLASQTGSR